MQSKTFQIIEIFPEYCSLSKFNVNFMCSNFLLIFSYYDVWKYIIIIIIIIIILLFNEVDMHMYWKSAVNIYTEDRATLFIQMLKTSSILL